MTGRDKLTVWRPTTTTTLQLYSLELLGGVQQKWCKLYSLVSGSPESRVYPLFLRIKLYLELNYTIFY